MKLRSGFVSNSSSASFILIGFEFDSLDELKKQFKIEDDEKLTEYLEKEDLQIMDQDDPYDRDYLAVESISGHSGNYLCYEHYTSVDNGEIADLNPDGLKKAKTQFAKDRNIEEQYVYILLYGKTMM